MKTQVVSVANRIPGPSEPYYRYQTFHQSLARFGTPPEMLGLHEDWWGLMTKPRRLREWLRGGNCKAEFLIVCDAFDIVFAAPPDEVGAFYEEKWPAGPIVFNAEKGLFPRPELQDRFDEIGVQWDALESSQFDDIDSPWKYLNSGFFIGRPEKILALLEAMWLDDISDDHPSPDHLHGGGGRMINPNDQGWYQLMYCAQVVPMVLDRFCQMVQCLSGCTPEEFNLDGQSIRNVVTGTTPLVWHFNGGSKNDLMPAFLPKWGL